MNIGTLKKSRYSDYSISIPGSLYLINYTKFSREHRVVSWSFIMIYISDYMDFKIEHIWFSENILLV